MLLPEVAVQCISNRGSLEIQTTPSTVVTPESTLHWSREDIASNNPLAVHSEELRFVREPEEQFPDGQKTSNRGVGEKCVLSHQCQQCQILT